MFPKRFIPILGFLLLAALCPDARPADALTVAAVGDVMMGTAWPEEILPPGDGEGIFDDVRESLAGADIVFGNLEGPLVDEGEGVKCRRKPDAGNRGTAAANSATAPKKLCFEFRTPTRYARHLAAAGFNVMNVSNNHALDFGPEGAESTVAALRDAGIQAAGGERLATFRIGGKRVALAGFSYSPPPPYTYSVQNLAEAMEIVRRLKTEYDLVIVSFHVGAEGKDAVLVPDAEELFAGENRGNAFRFARGVIEAGADLVIGHGPHVPRALELYRGKLIAYSLGNFLTYGRFNLQGPSGIGLVLRVSIDLDTGDFAGGTIVPVELRDGGIPFVDPEKRSIALVRWLTELLPVRSGLVIGADGSLAPLPPPSSPAPVPDGESDPPDAD